MAELPPISEDIFEQKKAQMVSANASAISEMVYKCLPCNKTFKSTEQMDEHKKSKKHKKNEKESRKANPDLDDSTMFQSISQGGDKSIGGENVMGDLSESVGGEKLDIDAESETTVPAKKPKMTALQNLRCCLFCNQECGGIKKCLDHMRRQHSFTLLDVDCLIDLKGLLTYLAARIHEGYLCLHCSKQHRDATRCQQHMLDKSHCIFNMEDEEEYLDYYDFSKTYKNHPLLIEKEGDMMIKEAGENEEGGDGASDGWEDCDLDDDEDVKKEETKEAGFQVVGESDGSESFKIIDKEGNTDNDDITLDSKGTGHSKNDFELQKGTGKTRDEAFLGLEIKKAKLLPTGEVLLGNGKLMGHRQYHQEYKKRVRLPDTRDAILIGKIALEYRKINALQNGGKGDSLYQQHKKEFKDRLAGQKAYHKAYIKIQMQANSLQHHFVDPTGHLQ